MQGAHLVVVLGKEESGASPCCGMPCRERGVGLVQALAGCCACGEKGEQKGLVQALVGGCTGGEEGARGACHGGKQG